jgi:hypothetical protein
MTKDYSLTLQDSSGRQTVLYINGDSIDQLGGDAYAVECVEGNAFQTAIGRGEIGEDAYVININE